MPASPDWFYNSYEECIELVASLPTLLERWTQDIREKHIRAKDELDKDSEQQHGEEATQDDISKFRRIRRELHDKIVAIKKSRAYLTPSELVGTGHHRSFLHNLFEVARISDLLGDLDAQLQLAELVQDRASDRVRRLTEEQRDEKESKFATTTNYLLLGVGSFAFAGVAEMFDHQWFGDKYNIDEGSLPFRWLTPWLNMALWILAWAAITVMAIMYLRGKRLRLLVRTPRLTERKHRRNRWNRRRRRRQAAERSDALVGPDAEPQPEIGDDAISGPEAGYVPGSASRPT
jgi:hypothetical protein